MPSASRCWSRTTSRHHRPRRRYRHSGRLPRAVTATATGRTEDAVTRRPHHMTQGQAAPTLDPGGRRGSRGEGAQVVGDVVGASVLGVVVERGGGRRSGRSTGGRGRWRAVADHGERDVEVERRHGHLAVFDMELVVPDRGRGAVAHILLGSAAVVRVAIRTLQCVREDDRADVPVALVEGVIKLEAGGTVRAYDVDVRRGPLYPEAGRKGRGWRRQDIRPL